MPGCLRTTIRGTWSLRRCCRSLVWVHGLVYCCIVSLPSPSFILLRWRPPRRDEWSSNCGVVCQHLLACGDDRGIRHAREGAAGIGERSSSRPAASTTNPQALVRIGVEQRMTRMDILFTTTATYCTPDVHSLLFICWCRRWLSVVVSDVQETQFFTINSDVV